MNAKHTPGPWAFCNETLRQANGNYLHLGKWIESAGLGKAAAANAALIAAAPELLDALQAFVTQRDKLAGFPQAVDPYSGAYVAARAAIAKATGA